MELIPILSTIILVATISTFILAVGAYILYNIRERKTRDLQYRMYKQYDSEYVEPEINPADKKVYVEDLIAKNNLKIEKPGKFQRVQTEIKETREISPNISSTKEEIKKAGSNGSSKVIIPESRFKKYTVEDYIEPEKEEPVGEIKWR